MAESFYLLQTVSKRSNYGNPDDYIFVLLCPCPQENGEFY